jgi:hypothetical protein
VDRENAVEEGAFSSWRRKLFLPLDEKNPRDRRGGSDYGGEEGCCAGAGGCVVA